MRNKRRVKKVFKKIDRVFERCRQEKWTYDRLNDELVHLWDKEGLWEKDQMHCSVCTGMGD